MVHSRDILISVHHRYVLSMMVGTKTAEVRRRAPKVEPGTRVWIYSKLPRGRVEVVATVENVVQAAPRKLWGSYRSRIAISAAEFRAYLAGVELGCVILLRDVAVLDPTLNLADIRRTSKKFHPPQFFKRLSPRGPELRSLTASAVTLGRAGSAYRLGFRAGGGL